VKNNNMALSQQPHPVDRSKTIVFWAAVIAGVLPAIWLIWAFFTNNLGTHPVSTINNVTGRSAMILLLASLAFTPLNTMFDLHWEFRVRRALGLWAFAYASLHFLNFVGLDYGFDIQFMQADGIATMPYIIVGFVALVLLVPLALTSNTWSFKRLGYRGWRRLHSIVYLIAVLVMIHFFLQAKVAERWEPFLYSLVLALLLIVRIPAVSRRLAGIRGGQQRK